MLGQALAGFVVVEAQYDDPRSADRGEVEGPGGGRGWGDLTSVAIITTEENRRKMSTQLAGAAAAFAKTFVGPHLGGVPTFVDREWLQTCGFRHGACEFGPNGRVVDPFGYPEEDSTIEVPGDVADCLTSLGIEVGKTLRRSVDGPDPWRG